MGVQIRVTEVLTLLALIGTFTFGIATFLNYKFYKRLEDHREVTIEMFLLRGEIEEALKILLVSILIFGFSGLVTVIGSRVGSPILAGAIVMGFAVFFVAYMLFFLTLYFSDDPERSFPFLRDYLDRE